MEPDNRIGMASPLRAQGDELVARGQRLLARAELLTLGEVLPAPALRTDAMILVQAQAEIEARRRRARYFPASLLGEPAWDILLELCVEGINDRRVAIGSAWAASGVPPATARRWLALLRQEGLVRINDEDSANSQSRVSLSCQGRDGFKGYFAAPGSVE